MTQEFYRLQNEMTHTWNFYTNVHSKLFTLSKKAETTPVYTDRWLDNVWSIHAVVYYLGIKINEVLIHAKTWLNLENIPLYETVTGNIRKQFLGHEDRIWVIKSSFCFSFFEKIYVNLLFF